MSGFALESPGESMRRWAELSPCGKYRYVLGRRWSDGPLALFCGANPSTASHEVDDATSRKWVGFCKRHGGVGGYVAVNLYAYRSRDPRELPADGASGPDNDLRIFRVLAAEAPPLIVACWGDAVSHMPDFKSRAALIGRILGPEALCWGRTSSGNPRHPLMLPYAAKLESLWDAPASSPRGEGGEG